MTTHYHVAAGILRDAAGRILITERLCDGPFNGLWEFPGGKIVAGETPFQALKRELVEELGVEIIEGTLFMNLRHEYPDRNVRLEFFEVNGWIGEPQGLEGQQIRWVAPTELDPAVLLPADAPVIERLRKA